jgi:hypothetical protein
MLFAVLGSSVPYPQEQSLCGINVCKAACYPHQCFNTRGWQFKREGFEIKHGD